MKNIALDAKTMLALYMLLATRTDNQVPVLQYENEEALFKLRDTLYNDIVSGLEHSFSEQNNIDLTYCVPDKRLFERWEAEQQDKMRMKQAGTQTQVDLATNEREYPKKTHKRRSRKSRK